MAIFRATIQGCRSEVSRIGTADSGIEGHICGRNIGCRVRGYVGDDGKDYVEVARSHAHTGNIYG